MRVDGGGRGDGRSIGEAGVSLHVRESQCATPELNLLIIPLLQENNSSFVMPNSRALRVCLRPLAFVPLS